MKLSSTKINTYFQCPLKYKLSYIDNLGKFINNIYFERGKYIHLLLEKYPNKPLKIPKYEFLSDNDIEELNKIFDNFIQNEEVKLLLEKYRFNAEEKFYFDENLEITDSKEYLFSGVIDYIGGINDKNYIIIDWKTGKSKVEDSIQLISYCIYVFKKYNCDCIKTIYYYVETNERDSKLFYKKDLQNLENELLYKIQTVLNDNEYNPKMNKYCEYCEFINSQYCNIMKVNIDLEKK